MSNVFCQCDKCARDILVGETMVSLTMTRDKIIDESCVQPVFADAVGMWCHTCADKLTIGKKIEECRSPID